MATQILREEPRAIYLHCMGHSLNLAVQDTCRSIKEMSDTFDTAGDLKVNEVQCKEKGNVLPRQYALYVLRDGAESLRSVIANYEVRQELMDIIKEYQGITEATSAVKGILSTMEKFSFLFGVVVSELFFSITDKLS